MDVQLKSTLGIDLGTSSVKVGLYDSGLNIIDSQSEPYDVKYVGYGGAEQSPDDWWNAIVTAALKIEERNPEKWKMLASIGVAGQFSGTVPVGNDGIPVRDAIIWLDSRGEEATRRAISGFPSIAGYRIDKLYRWIRLTGGAPTRSGKDSISHILYLRENEPGVYSSTSKFLEPKDYINFRLTGIPMGTFDSVVLDWLTDNRDPGKIGYSNKLLKMLGLERSKFPDLTGSWNPVGRISEEVAELLHTGKDIVVAGGSGDIQSTLVGSGCLKSYEPLIYVGTSSWLTLHVPFKKTDLSHNIASLPAALPGSYFVAAEQESAGSAMTYIRDLLFHESALPSFGEMDRMAEKAAPGSTGLVFLPWLYGERAPVEDRNLRGSFYNLSMTHDRSSIIRSVMEGVAYNMKWLTGIVERFSGKSFEFIRMAGGGASSSLWPQIISDILQKEIRVIEDPVLVNARGASILALMASGELDESAVASLGSDTKHFRPAEDARKAHERNFNTFLQFYHNNRKHMNQLNGTRQC